jgi:putative redox protein
MVSTITLNVEVGNLRGKMNLTGKGHTPSTVSIDYPPPLGDDGGFTSLELLMVSLASCSAHTVKYVLGASGTPVDDIRVHATGQRRMNVHPTVLTKIELDYSLAGKQLTSELVENAIRKAEESMCPVWALLKGNVEITWRFTIR